MFRFLVEEIPFSRIFSLIDQVWHHPLELVAGIPEHEQVDPYEWDSDLSVRGQHQVPLLGKSDFPSSNSDNVLDYLCFRLFAWFFPLCVLITFDHTFTKVAELGVKVKEMNLEPELIISSPLTRALKTTYGAFGSPQSVHIHSIHCLIFSGLKRSSVWSNIESSLTFLSYSIFRMHQS